MSAKRWIDRKKRRSRKDEERHTPAIEQQAKRTKQKEEEPREYEYGVLWVPIKCPRCGTKNIKINTTLPECRYCKCDECQALFKAIEIDLPKQPI